MRCKQLLRQPATSASISLEPAAIEIEGRRWDLSMAADAKNRLLNGQDATSQLLQQEQALKTPLRACPTCRVRGQH